MTEKRKFGGSQPGSGRKKLGKVKATFSISKVNKDKLPNEKFGEKSELVDNLLTKHFKTIEDGEHEVSDSNLKT